MIDSNLEIIPDIEEFKKQKQEVLFQVSFIEKLEWKVHEMKVTFTVFC